MGATISKNDYVQKTRNKISSSLCCCDDLLPSIIDAHIDKPNSKKPINNELSFEILNYILEQEVNLTKQEMMELIIDEKNKKSEKEISCGTIIYILEQEANLTKEEMMELLVMQICHYGNITCTTLQLALHFNKSIGVILKLLAIGGNQLVMITDSETNSVLHSACNKNNISIDIISAFLNTGGKELAIMVDYDYRTALHRTCMNKSISFDIISLLIDVGGKDLVLMPNRWGETALHNYMCKNKSISVDIISALVDVGGKELVLMTDCDGATALHQACDNKNVSVDIISALINVGRKELVAMTDYEGNTALYHGLRQLCCSRFNQNCNDTFEFILKQCILANIGGGYGIGGLLNTANKRIQDDVYKEWDNFTPALQSTIQSLKEEQLEQPPILHAAILAKAPLHIIRSIIQCFEYSVLKLDRLNKYPIEMALDEGLEWNDGLQEIVQATLKAQKLNPRFIYTAAQHGLKWQTHYMKEFIESNVDEVMFAYDVVTGLRVFMVTAMGDCNDLSSIFGTMRMTPEIINISL